MYTQGSETKEHNLQNKHQNQKNITKTNNSPNGLSVRMQDRYIKRKHGFRITIYTLFQIKLKGMFVELFSSTLKLLGFDELKTSRSLKVP